MCSRDALFQVHNIVVTIKQGALVRDLAQLVTRCVVDIDHSVRSHCSDNDPTLRHRAADLEVHWD
eukprot:2420036-Alexandrium_andersonii.AAC.1